LKKMLINGPVFLLGTPLGKVLKLSLWDRHFYPHTT
jgi:hypothetical protein